MATHLIGQLICDTGAQVEIVEAHLPEHIHLTRLEPGCIRFEVTQSADPKIWDVRESFDDRAAFDAHQTRTKASLWADVTKDIRRVYEITED